MRKLVLLLICAFAFVAGCSNLPVQVNIVPTTGDTANDAASAQNQMPNIAGYNSVDAASITDAVAAVGGGASLLSGNPAITAAIAKIDDMIACYRQVGAVAARVYTDANITQVVQGQIPKVGALAIINRNRLTDNFLPCALNTGSGIGAQSADVIEPCAGVGSFTRGSDTFDYVYAATDPTLCNTFVTALQ